MKKRTVGLLLSIASCLMFGTVLSYPGWKAGSLLGEEDEGIQPAPWYVPPEKFSPDANQPIALDAAVGPNVRVNSRDLCGGRGNTQSETSVAISGDVVVVAFNDSRGFYCPGHSTVGWGYSLDGGQTFTDGGTLPGGLTPWSNGDPWVVAGPDGSFYVSGISNNFSGMSVSRGTVEEDGTITWSFPVQAVTGAGSIDKEAMVVDQSTGTLYMAYGRSQQVELIRSEDQGATWSSPVILGSGGIGALPVFGPNGELYLTWLVGWPGPNQRILARRSDDGGLSFGPPVLVSTVCPINVPGFNRGQMPAFPSLAVDKSGGAFNGRVYLTNHSSCPPGNGDAYLAYSDNGGETWSDPVIVNDDATTAIHFSPWVDVDDFGTVSVAFYDRRENPGTGTTNVYFAQSFDGGATFTENVRLNEVATNWSATASDITPNFGDYINTRAVGSDVVVAWSDGRQGDPDAYITRISASEVLKRANGAQSSFRDQ